MRRPALLLLATALLAAPAAAQGDAAPATPETRRIVAVFTIQGRLNSPTTVPSLPTTLVERLAREPSLATLTMNSVPGASGLVVAQFAFSSEADFRAWYTRPETRELFRMVEQAVRQPDYAFTLKHFPAAQLVRAAQASP